MMDKEILFKTLNHYDIFIDNEYVNTYHSETVNHIIRCSQLAKSFGIYLNLSENDLNNLIECALLHDIGKFQLNPNILYKTGKLTDEEYTHIKSHTNFEGNVSKLSKSILDCINYHHDNGAKTGYNKIDISTKHEFVKIISLIDCYDVMSNKRCYKDYTISLDAIINEIKKNIGGQFDLYYGHKFIEFIRQINVVDIVS